MSSHDKTNLSPFPPPTRWTLVRHVQKGGEAEATRAMEEICRQYWYPIYAFARRAGFFAHDAEDLTRTFSQRVITSETLQAASEEKGRLRSFMLSLLQRVISNHIRDASAEKRGGSPAATVSLYEDDGAEARRRAEPAGAHDPDALFDRAWAARILQAAEKGLRWRVGKPAGHRQVRDLSSLPNYSHQVREFCFRLLGRAHRLRDFLLDQLAVALSHAVDLQAQGAFGDGEFPGDLGIWGGFVAVREKFAEPVGALEIVCLHKLQGQVSDLSTQAGSLCSISEFSGVPFDVRHNRPSGNTRAVSSAKTSH